MLADNVREEMLLHTVKNALRGTPGMIRLMRRHALRAREMCMGAPSPGASAALPWRLLEPFKNPKIDLATALHDGWKPLEAESFASSLKGIVILFVVFVRVWAPICGLRLCDHVFSHGWRN